MTNQSLTVTVAGARGGSGTSTVAAALALFASRTLVTELVTADVGTAAALLGLGPTADPSAPIDVADSLTLVSTATDGAQVSVVDAGRLDQLAETPPGLFLVASRGPCYLGLRSIVTSGLQAAGIVLLGEAGRSLTDRDVRDVCGVPVVAQIPITPNVARTIDAGRLVTRVHVLRELAALHAYIDYIIAPTEPTTRARRQHPSASSRQHLPTRTASRAPASPRLGTETPKHPSKIVTDMPLPLCGSSRAPRRFASRRCRPSGTR